LKAVGDKKGEQAHMGKFPTSGPVRLRTNLADYANTRALKAGEIKSDLVSFDFAGPKTAAEGFKPMLRENQFQAGELAIATYLLAREFGKPYVLLPATILGRYQHGFLYYNTDKGALTPKALEGRRVGVRSYSVTTTMWVRAILQHDYGVDLERIKWAAYEDSHLAEFREPPSLERFELKGRKLDQMLAEGDFDAAILGADAPYPNVKPLIPDPAAAAREWAAKHGGAVQLNHLFVVDAALSRERPDVIQEIWRLLLASKAATPTKPGPDTLPFGLESMRHALELAVQYAVEQKILSKPISVDDLFDDTTRALKP
jgi:4,5-dihydroxyphthalate decarboxylase